MNKFFHKDWEKDNKNIEKDLIAHLENPDTVLEQGWKLKLEQIKRNSCRAF